MTRSLIGIVLLLGAVALADEPRVVPASAVVWKDAPDMPPGVQISPVFGDPKTGPFQILMKMPKGTRIPPHWHSATEVLTVVSGEAVIGWGATVDEAHGKVLGAGGYAVIPPRSVHWGLARTDVMAVRFADGPADTHPVVVK